MKLVGFVAIACLFVLIQAGPSRDLSSYTFEQYVSEFGKAYKGSQFDYHRNLFEKQMDVIREHNKKGGSYWMDVNKFTDMDAVEISRFRGYKINSYTSSMPEMKMDLKDLSTLPTELDWRKRTPAVVSPVKDQRSCGGCWAFSATESIESALAIATGNITILSPQNLISCTPNPQHCGGTGGCDGATCELAFDYVSKTGIATESEYPYHATNGVCNNSTRRVATVTGFVKVEENSYLGLMNAIQITPVSISVDASAWSGYGGGVFDGCSHTRLDIDHAVQLVGYGTTGTQDYWIVRNSWGPDWGENGYIRLLRHSDADPKWCVIDSTPSDGSGCDGGPDKVTVCGTCGILYDNSYPLGAKFL